MPRQSSVTKLPKEVKDTIARLRENGRTIDEIMLKLKELDVDISRSALGRHIKEFDYLVKNMAMTRDMATALVGKLEETNGDDRLARANAEMLHGLLFKLLMTNNQEDQFMLDAKEAMFLATTIQKLTDATRIDTERELKLRKEFAAETAKAVGSLAKKQGLSDELITAFKKEILGAGNG